MSAQESCSAELHRLWKTNATEVPHQRPRGPVAELLEDETLYSYLTRIFMLSGKVSERDFIRDCFGFRVKNLTTNGANRHVLKFLDRLPVGHPLRDDPEARYLLTTTRYDAFFAPQEDRSTRLSSSSEGMPEHASIASRGRWSPLMKPCIPSACLDCMRDDRLSDGVVAPDASAPWRHSLRYSRHSIGKWMRKLRAMDQDGQPSCAANLSL